MNPAAREILGMATQRGFWLRCFLGGVLFVLAGMGPAVPIPYAQCVYPVIRISRVQGAVYDPSGVAIPNVKIELKNPDKIVATVTTNEHGEFSMAAAPGRYNLLANAQAFAPGFASIDVGNDLATAFVATRLYMILNVGMTVENCTLTTTSRRKFEKAVREFTQKK